MIIVAQNYIMSIYLPNYNVRVFTKNNYDIIIKYNKQIRAKMLENFTDIIEPESRALTVERFFE